MTGSSSLPALILALLTPVAPIGSDRDGDRPVELAQLTIHERIVIRVPRMSGAPIAPVAPAPMTWREKGGPHCVASDELAGALITQPGAVDLVMRGGKRLRAQLAGNCGPLDFYSGFYLKRSADGKVCSGRDAVRVRSGAACPIARFRTLVPQPARR